MMRIRKIFLIKLAKYSFLYPSLFFLKRKLSNKKKLAILIGTPIHRNLGDHLIAEVELKLLKKIYNDREIIEIPTDIFLEFKTLLVQYIKNDAIILISGGGWMGDVWAQDDKNMQDIISTFSNHKIVVLPQTLYFENEKRCESQELILNARENYAKCNQLTMMFRDKHSFEVANRLYKNVIKHIYLFPDIALFKTLFMERYTIDKNRHGILFCFREDREKVRNINVEEDIKNYLESNGFSFNYSSTMTRHAVPVWLRGILIKNKIMEFSKYELVITDRLHGMIYAYLSGSKCIAIDNKTHKISGVFNQWITPYEAISVVSEKDNSNKLISEIEEMMALRVYNNKFDMSNKYQELKMILEDNYES